MTYNQKLTRIGNSVGVVIPKELRDLLNLEVGSELYIQSDADNKTIVLSKEKPGTKVDAQFFELVKEIGKQYETSLKELASK
jgi:putative addiction module antidote